MVDYKRILRLRAEGVSQRGIADVMGCSRNTVAAVFTAANAAGIGFDQVADLAWYCSLKNEYRYGTPSEAQQAATYSFHSSNSVTDGRASSR
jgi:transcriptional regulator with XRE-family HTH domain